MIVSLGQASTCYLVLLMVMASHSGSAQAGWEVKDINLLSSLHLHNTTFSGLDQQPGPHSPEPAAFFTGSSRAVYFSSPVRDSITSLIQSSKEFSFLTSIRQQRQNSGTIFAFSYGKYQTNRYLEIQSSGRQDVLRVHYSPAKSELGTRVESFPLRLADDSWHRLAVTVSGDQLEVTLDCRSVHRRVVPAIDTSFLPTEPTSLTAWLGQSNQDNFLFKGYLQETRLVSGPHGVLAQCPNSDTACPTCGQFSDLRDTVTNMQNLILELGSRLEAAEARIQELEKCECSQSCGERRHLETWRQGCDNCTCKAGTTQCSPVICPEPACAQPDPPAPGQCCPTCRKPCAALDNLTPALSHGEVWNAKRCHLCQCDDGHLQCSNQEPLCPLLDCPHSQRIVEEGKCCPVCRESDYCSRGHDCHPRAKCKNGLFNYSCHCNEGFQGNGSHCVDVDECSVVGGPGGHHCTLEHGLCVNLEGGYTCGCEVGYKLDPTNTTCQPVDVCQTGEGKCHSEAVCVSTGPGTHVCTCREGFTGDGDNCYALCQPACNNGGLCVAPDRCECASGYTGDHCEQDLDECSLGESVHGCGGESVCINKVGWYYCACKEGYTSYHNPVDGSTTCRDVDECEARTDTCHQTATCLNSPGGYSCECEGGRQCSYDCRLEGESHSDGAEWRDGCNQCSCEKGRVTCHQLDCDCQAGADPGCCPQCEDSRRCRHQEIPGLTFTAGQRWVHHCMECECLHGEVDCWPADCPPLTTCKPHHHLGSCCPSCRNLPVSCGNSSCLHQSLVRQEGETWSLPSQAPPDCTRCHCKNGLVYCNTEPSCVVAGLPDPGGQHGDQQEDGGTFLEKIQIPESDHDNVPRITSEAPSPSQRYKHFSNKHKLKQFSRSKTKTFEFSNELIQRYIAGPPRDEDID